MNQSKVEHLTKRSTLIVALFLMLFTGTVYGFTLSPTINSFDSAELITGAYTLGIVHSPGYPLYLLLANLATRLPWGTVAFNINALSALFASLSVTILFFACWRLSRVLWSSLLAALLLGFSRLFWSQAVVTEIYTLNTLLASLIILTTIIYYQRPTRVSLMGLALVSGVTLTHHPSAVLLLPGVVFLVWRVQRRAPVSTRVWLQVLLTAGLPLLLYLYLPIRFKADPPFNYVADYFSVDLSSPEGIFWMVSGKMFARELLGRQLSAGLWQTRVFLNVIWLELLGAGFLFALYGLYLLRRKVSLLILFAGGSLLIVVFFAFYDVIDNQKMILPVFILLGPPIACGADRFLQDLLGGIKGKRNIIRVFEAGILIIMTSILLGANWSSVDRRGDWSAYSWAQKVLEQVEPKGVILTQWTGATPLTYMQIVEGQRTDVTVIDRGMAALGIRDDQYRQGNTSATVAEAAIRDYLRQVVREALEGGKTIYVTEDDPALRSLFCYETLSGNLYRIVSLDPDCAHYSPAQ